MDEKPHTPENYGFNYLSRFNLNYSMVEIEVHILHNRFKLIPYHGCRWIEKYVARWNMLRSYDS